jgi:hypothetical protein
MLHMLKNLELNCNLSMVPWIQLEVVKHLFMKDISLKIMTTMNVCISTSNPHNKKESI